jgi:hypothetical protein
MQFNKHIVLKKQICAMWVNHLKAYKDCNKISQWNLKLHKSERITLLPERLENLQEA